MLQRQSPAVLFILLAATRMCFALGQPAYVQTTAAPGSFPIVQNKTAAVIYVDANDHAGVIRAAKGLQADIARVTGCTPTIIQNPQEFVGPTILVGTIGKSPSIDRLIGEKKIDPAPIAGKWEASLIQTLDGTLVIAGSDKRGTIYGIYDLSEQVGVSPWYWWADVPVAHKDELFVQAGPHVQGPPAVKYRGIFLNDEAPALTGWTREKFGGYNHQFYEKVFELLLRLKANYLWPAMWNSAFNEDDPLNPKLADEYGIVMGTSHQEAMLRAQKEWDRRHNNADWNYADHADVLEKFWREGIARNKNYESIITIGMRGRDDSPMIRGGTEAQSMELLEKIVAVQRKILADEMNADVTKVPQMWCVYKEVQGYYEKGMRVPDDVTLLWCDDNWGNIRRLPTPDERKRGGGAGVYYHFDYAGGPRSYKWLNTNPIPKIWEQMNLAYEYGADRIWIVNVGDLKPMEFPIEFFMHLAWNPKAWPRERLSEYTRLWAAREFGPKYADDIADIISKYAKYNGRRKPELLDPATYSIVNYHEADTVLADFKSIVARAERIYADLPVESRDAFYQLVLHPAKASALVNEIYITAARNQLYATQGRASTNDLAQQTRELFQEDAKLTDTYNNTLAGGKWNHMMDQAHLGYTFWNQPPKNTMPAVTELQIFEPAEMGVAVEGLTAAWPGGSGEAILPTFDCFNQPRRYIDVFNRGRTPFEFVAQPSQPWIILSQSRGKIEKETRLDVTIDWSKAPQDSAAGEIKFSQSGSDAAVTVKMNCFNPAEPKRETLQGFVQADGYVSIEAEHYTKKIDTSAARWEKIDDYGRTLSAMTAVSATSASSTPPESPRLEYQMYLFDAGKIEVESILAPTLGFVPGRGLRFGISFDNEPPQIIDALAQNTTKDWEKSVADSVRKVRSTHTIDKPGYHTLKFWMVDPGVALEKVIINPAAAKPSYLGPPESYRGAISASAPQSPR